MNKKQLLVVSLASLFFSGSVFSYGGYVVDSSGDVVRTASGCLHYGNFSGANCPDDKAPMKEVKKVKMPMAAPKMMKEEVKAEIPAPAPKIMKEETVSKPVMKAEIEAPVEVVKKVINLEGVNFKTGSNELTGASLNTLDSMAQGLKANPDTRIIVAGHTDSRGNASNNLKLSQARAEAVMHHLIDQGVDKSQLTAKGYGDTEAIASNDSSEGRAKNRRVELRILN